MAEVQNIGAVDYNQFQPNQLQTLPEQDIANMPVVYDEATEAKKASGMGMVGATILGATMLVVGGLIGKKMGAKGLKAAEEAAEVAKLKAEEALKKYEQMQDATAKIEEAIKENNDLGFLGRFKGFQKMKDKISKLIKPFKKEPVETPEEIKDAAKKAQEIVDDTMGKAKDAAGKAEDAAA